MISTCSGWVRIPGAVGAGRPTFSRECRDACGRQMTQYADEFQRLLHDSVYETGYGRPCNAAPKPPPVDLPQFVPQFSGAPAGGVSVAAQSRALPPGCAFYGMKGGRRVLLCPNKRGKMVKRLEGLGAAMPETSMVEPFVWLAGTGLLLWAVTKKESRR